jgi:spermidine/putrescine transport system ATP-binding protein
MSADVQLDHMYIRFGDFTAVDDANLQIEEGEFFSFLGPSGCGQTTILRAVSTSLSASKSVALANSNAANGQTNF